MKHLKKYFEANQKMWDEFARLHYDSKTYKTKEFLDGKITLNSIELEEVGDVKGKTLLHLQCHFGLDTLSWAREGAIVTGVDFSSEAINLACKLGELTQLDARFIESNIYDLPEVLDDKFDIVFTSYGVHCWLPDLQRWAEIVEYFVKPGGLFYIAEFHPVIWMFDNEDANGFKLKYSYFHNPEPYRFDVDGSYAETEQEFEPCVDYEWAHGMGEVVTSIAQAGLRIEYLHEFPMASFQSFPFLEQRDDGYWYYEDPDIQLPLMYSIRARKSMS
jgi:SAM-dependent methyltransferase